MIFRLMGIGWAIFGMIELTVRKREKRGWKIKEKVGKGERKRERLPGSENISTFQIEPTNKVYHPNLGSVSLYKPFQIHAICSRRDITCSLIVVISS